MQKRASSFAGTIQRRGPKAFEVFIRTLIETDQVNTSHFTLIFKLLDHNNLKIISYVLFLFFGTMIVRISLSIKYYVCLKVCLMSLCFTLNSGLAGRGT